MPIRPMVKKVDALRSGILTYFRSDIAGNYLEYFRGWVYACIMARADGLADLTWQVKVRSPSSQGGSELAGPDNWFVRLLEQPNPLPWVTWKTIVKSIEVWQSLTGEAYLWTPKVGGGSKPNQIWVVPATCCRPIASDEDLFGGFEMTTPRGTVRIPREEMIYLPLLGPAIDFASSMMRGQSRVAMALDVIQVEHYIHAYLKQYFAKNAVPEFVIESETGAEMYSHDWEAFLQRWLQHHQGAEAGVPMGYLPAGWRLKEVNTTANKDSLLGMADKNLETIIGIWKVPRGILTGQYDAAAPASSFNALRYTFLKGAISPVAGEIAAIVSRWAQLHDRSTILDVEPVTWSEPAEVRADELHRLVTGRATINDLRLENGEGELPVEQGGVVFLGRDLIALSSILDSRESSQS